MIAKGYPNKTIAAVFEIAPGPSAPTCDEFLPSSMCPRAQPWWRG